MERTAEYIRKTKETDIKINLNIDGTGKAEIDTGIGFFDHMLEGFARHGFLIWMSKWKGILPWTAITRSKTPESCLVMRSAKR